MVIFFFLGGGGSFIDVVTCASFDIETLRGLDFTRDKFLLFPTETTGHLYNWL